MEDNKENNQIPKPLVVALDEFKTDLINLVNNAHLSAYLLEHTFKEIYEQCKSQAQQELFESKKAYREAQKEQYTQAFELNENKEE